MEAVQNAAKHSGAATVSVRVEEDSDRWVLTVADDGTGFDQAHATAACGIGLASMRDRLDAVGGNVQIVSGEHIGTTVIARVPRTNEAAGAPATPSLQHQVG
jgi:signal transduction histidine kinase